MILQSTAKGGRVVPRPKSQIISALFSTTYDFAVLKMGLRALREEWALPVGVFGPVECRAFWRLARRCSLETTFSMAYFFRL